MGGNRRDYWSTDMPKSAGLLTFFGGGRTPPKNVALPDWTGEPAPMQPRLSATTSPAVEIDAFDASPRRFVMKGFAVLLVTLGGFGGWAAMAPLDSAAIAPGIVVVDGGRHKVQHPVGGVVHEMLVRDGDRVDEGQVLLSLDPTQAAASHSIVEADYIVARAELARLLAEIKDNPNIVFDESLLAEADQPGLHRALEVQEALFARRVSLRRQQIDVLKAQIEQSKNEITALDAERVSRSRQMDLLSEELDGLRQLLEKGLTAKTRVLELQRSLESLRGDRLSIEASIAKTRNRINELQGEITLLRTTAQDQLHAEMKQVQLKLLQTHQELIRADDVLRRIEVRAPIAGVIVNNNVVTQGGVADAGEVIMEIVPDRNALMIDARVSINDIDSVEVGQHADILLKAFNQATTPTLTGHVEHVAADRQVDLANSQPYFQVGISVPEEEIARLEEGLRLQPGMPADAVIVTGERTVMEYLLRPITLSFARSWREE